MKEPGKWTWEHVSPDTAERYLKTAGTRQRKIRTNKVSEYVNKQRSGTFGHTHQGIAFDEHGVLVDGRHRLTSIVVSGISTWLWVYRANRAMDVSKIDRTITRTTYDHLNIGGKSADARQVSLLRRLLWGIRTEGRFDSDVELEQFSKHASAIRFALSLFEDCRIKSVNSSLVLGMFARAYYTADRDRLTEMAHILVTGETRSPTRDRAALRLRDWLMTPSTSLAGSKYRKEAVQITEQAIRWFLDGECGERLTKTKVELFPIKVEIPTMRELVEAKKAVEDKSCHEQ